MISKYKYAKVNVKVLIILILVTTAIGISLFTARQVRRSLLSKMDLEAGQAAYNNQDWPTASSKLRGYLSRNPDNLEILKKYAQASLSIRPINADILSRAVSAYRRILQLNPADDIAYEKLAMLYAGIGNFEELAYISETRLNNVPDDRKAVIWRADALVRLHKTDEAREILESFLADLDTLDEKYPEYAQACAIMSGIYLSDNPVDAGAKALGMLNKAVEYNPQSAEAFLNRARFYREMLEISLARQDLETADDLETDNPRVYLSLGMEWIAHEKIDRAEAKLKLVESLSQETLGKYFFDIDDWTVSKFLLASQIAMKKRDTEEGVSLSDEILGVLKEKGHRVRVLPNAIGFYVIAGKVTEARRCLDEYIEITQMLEMPAESKLGLAFMQAQVARAEGRIRAVIDYLQPATASNPSRPEMWRFLAEAYSLSNQPRRAINALVQYLRFYPQDAEMTMQLAKEYLKQRDFNRAFEAAQRAESLDPTVLMIRLLRIEASIYIVAEQTSEVDSKRLEALSVELAELQKENPKRVDIRLLKAMVAEHLQKPQEAEAELQLAIEECTEPLMAEMQLVRHYSRLKRMDDAIKVCRAACERHPEVAVPWLSLSSLYVANEDYKTARSCLKQGLESATDQQNKRSLSISLAMLEFRDKNGDPNTGINLLKEIASHDEHEIGARLLLLDRPEIRKDPATAQKLVDELRKAEGQSGLYWRLHQASLWLSGDDWRSKQRDISDTLQYCIDSDPQWSQPVLLLARMYEKLGESERVEEICRQALVRNPSAAEVAGILLSLLEKQERFTEVDQILRQIEVSPRVMSAWNVQSALRAGEYSQAIEELRLRMPDDDQDANSRILLARLLYRQTRDAEQAFEYLKEAEAIVPGSVALIATKVSILRAENRAEEARQILDDYVKDNNSFISYSMRAAYLAGEGELERAEEDYRKLITFTGRETAGYELLSNFYSSNNNLDKAIMILEEGLKTYPKNPRLQRRLMSTLFLQKQPESQKKALEILTILEEQFPQDPELMKLRAINMLQVPTPQSLKTAREKLEQATELVPKDVDAHLALIDIAMRSGDYEAARDYAIRALDDNLNNMALRLARGKAEIAIGNTQMAAQIANLALQQDPNNTEALGVLLNAAVLTGSEDRSLIEGAIKSAHLMLEDDPNNPKVRDVIVAAALRSNDQKLLEEARTIVEAALTKEPANEMLLLSRTRILVSMNQPQAAIPELESYIQTQEGSHSVPAMVTLVDLYRLNGDMALAQQRIEQAGLIDPDNQSVIHAKLLLFIAQKRFDEIPEVCSTYLSIEEPNPATMTAAASILASMDSITLKKEGLKFYERVISLSPSLLSARLGLASTLYQTGDIQGAKQAYRKVLDQYPDNIRALNDLAWILQENDENYADALELAKRGLAVASDKKDILHLLDTEGTILSNMPDSLESARRDFTRLVDMSPDDTQQKAKALLKLGRVCIQLDDLENAKQHMKYALEIDKKINVLTPDERSEVTKILQES